MSAKIIVAGGGHGGIATAMLLAQNGFDVEVYEKSGTRYMRISISDAIEGDYRYDCYTDSTTGGRVRVIVATKR